MSTCGSVEIHEDKHMANFEGDFGNFTCKEINRLSTCPNSHEVLPLIDEHNIMRQHILGLEKKWLTKDFWFRLLATASGLTVVDMHWWHRSKNFKETPIELTRKRKMK